MYAEPGGPSVGVGGGTTGTDGVGDGVTATDGVGDGATGTDGVGDGVTGTDGVGDGATGTDGVGDMVTVTDGVGDRVTVTDGVDDRVTVTDGVGDGVSPGGGDTATVAVNVGVVGLVGVGVTVVVNTLAYANSPATGDARAAWACEGSEFVRHNQASNTLIRPALSAKASGWRIGNCMFMGTSWAIGWAGRPEQAETECRQQLYDDDPTATGCDARESRRASHSRTPPVTVVW